MDPVDRAPTLEQQMDDVQAVVRAADLERTSLFGVSDSGLCALYAAMHPDEVTSIVLWGVAASRAQAVTPEYKHDRVRPEGMSGDGGCRRARVSIPKPHLSQGRIGTRREPWAARGPAAVGAGRLRLVTWNVARWRSGPVEQASALAGRAPGVVALPEVTRQTLPLWGHSGGWRLDHIFASAELEVISCLDHHAWRDEGLSDHSALEADFV